MDKKKKENSFILSEILGGIAGIFLGDATSFGKAIAKITFSFLIGGFAFGQTVITNADFEQMDLAFDTKSFGWTREGILDWCESDSIDAFEGNYSMHLIKTNTQNTARFFQEIPFQTDALTKYKVSAAIKVKNIREGYAGVSIRVIDNLGRLVCHQNLNMTPSKIKGTQDWKIYEGEFYAVPTAVKLKIAGYLWGSGEAWYDQITIRETPFSKEKLTPDIAAYIEEYFAVVKKKSIVKDHTYLKQLRKNTIQLCRGNPTREHCHFVLKNITFNLNDGHSFFSTPEEWEELHDGPKNKQRGEAAFSSGKMLNEHIAYIHIPTFASVDRDLVKQSVDSLQHLIATLDYQNPKGWIIDLSNCSGGNSFAMFPGLGPLLGNGICAYSVSADGTKTALSYQNGLAGWNNQLDTLTAHPYIVKNPALPIAILYGNKTGSSGEVTALTFRGKENCKSFGQETGGYTTRIDNCILSDNASINLASGYDADRNGIVFYGTKIPPDVLTKNPEEALEKAKEWILSQFNK